MDNWYVCTTLYGLHATIVLARDKAEARHTAQEWYPQFGWLVARHITDVHDETNWLLPVPTKEERDGKV